MKTLVREKGQAYYFSHEIIKDLEKGNIIFVDKDGATLKPKYFGAGMSGMNGVLKPA